MSRTRSSARNRNATSPWPFVGMSGLACTFFLYAASGLLAPWWGVVLLLLVWVVLLLLSIAWWSLHPRWLPAVAVFSLVFWFAAVNAGAFFLGWSD